MKALIDLKSIKKLAKMLDEANVPMHKRYVHHNGVTLCVP